MIVGLNGAVYTWDGYKIWWLGLAFHSVIFSSEDFNNLLLEAEKYV